MIWSIVITTMLSIGLFAAGMALGVWLARSDEDRRRTLERQSYYAECERDFYRGEHKAPKDDTAF